MGYDLIYNFGEGSETGFGVSGLDMTSGKKILKFSVIKMVVSSNWVDSIRISLFIDESSEEDFSCYDDDD